MRNSGKKALIICSLLFMIFLFTPKAFAADIANGTQGNCSWRITNTNELIIAPLPNTNGSLGNIMPSNEETGGVTTASWDDAENCYPLSIEKVTILPGVKAGEYCSMFCDFESLSLIDGLDNLDVSNTADISNMFSYCYSLRSINFTSLHFSSKLRNIDSLFEESSYLDSLDLSSLNSTNVTSMYSVFCGCYNLRRIFGLNTLNTSRTTDMSYMFSYCSSLNQIDVSNFNTAQVTNMSYMFDTCDYLSSINLSHFDTQNVTAMEGMFYDCGSLSKLDVSSFNTSRVTNMDVMFSGCDDLTELDLSNFNTERVTSMLDFLNSNRLSTLKLGAQFDTYGATSSSLTEIASSGRGQYTASTNGKWYSTADQTFYSSNQVAERRKIADTYYMPLNLAYAKVGSLEKFPYTGEAIHPKLDVTLNKPLVEGVDYTIMYKDASGNITAAPTAKGIYTIIIKGLGRCAYTTIEKLNWLKIVNSLANAKINNLQSKYLYVGDSTWDPINQFSLTDDGKLLVRYVDYDFHFEEPESGLYHQTGEYRLVCTGTGNYAGSLSKSFSIYKNSMSTAQVTNINPYYETTHSSQMPKPIVSFEGKQLTEGTDYCVDYQNEDGTSTICTAEPGVYKVVITGMGSFKDTITKTYAITPYRSAQIIKDGVIYRVTKSGATRTLAAYMPTSKKITSITVPTSIKLAGLDYNVTSIDWDAFSGCTKLKEVRLDSLALERTGPRIFYNCKRLTKIVVRSKKINHIGSSSFAKMPKNVRVYLPSSKFKTYKKVFLKAKISRKAKFRRL